MGTIISNVIGQLTAAGIRSDEAYPGRRIPALTSPVAAVRLGKVDRSVRTTTVQVVIMSPSSGGGSLCETNALRALDALEEMGGSCVKDVCKFDEMADVFYIDLEAEFFGTALEDDWSAGPGYAVTIGEQALEYVISFSATRKTNNEGTLYWEFVLEELLPAGYSEPPPPSEPFALTVTRSKVDEMFTGCTLTTIKRENTIRGVSQVRSGTATNRSMIGAL